MIPDWEMIYLPELMSREGTGEQSGEEEAPDQDSLSGSGVSVKSTSCLSSAGSGTVTVLFS